MRVAQVGWLGRCLLPLHSLHTQIHSDSPPRRPPASAPHTPGAGRRPPAAPQQRRAGGCWSAPCFEGRERRGSICVDPVCLACMSVWMGCGWVSGGYSIRRLLWGSIKRPARPIQSIRSKQRTAPHTAARSPSTPFPSIPLRNVRRSNPTRGGRSLIHNAQCAGGFRQHGGHRSGRYELVSGHTTRTPVACWGRDQHRPVVGGWQSIRANITRNLRAAGRRCACCGDPNRLLRRPSHDSRRPGLQTLAMRRGGALFVGRRLAASQTHAPR